jgi:hypothetical protein
VVGLTEANPVLAPVETDIPDNLLDSQGVKENASFVAGLNLSAGTRPATLADRDG